jgi:hypothetical protein
MNLSITPHCRLDTQSYHHIALNRVTALLYLATTGRAPNRVATVAHDGNKTICGKLLLGFPYEIRATFVQQFTRCV